MSYPVFAVANEFINRKVPDLTPMKLQKLIYFANYWYFRNIGIMLVDEPFIRWQYGPVIPSLHHQLKYYGSDIVPSELSWHVKANFGKISIHVPTIPRSDDDSLFYINEVIHKYGIFTGPQLSSLTHRKGGAWAQKKNDGSVITSKELSKATLP